MPRSFAARAPVRARRSHRAWRTFQRSPFDTSGRTVRFSITDGCRRSVALGCSGSRGMRILRLPPPLASFCWAYMLRSVMLCLEHKNLDRPTCPTTSRRLKLLAPSFLLLARHFGVGHSSFPLPHRRFKLLATSFVLLARCFDRGHSRFLLPHRRFKLLATSFYLRACRLWRAHTGLLLIARRFELVTHRFFLLKRHSKLTIEGFRCGMIARR